MLLVAASLFVARVHWRILPICVIVLALANSFVARVLAVLRVLPGERPVLRKLQVPGLQELRGV